LDDYAVWLRSLQTFCKKDAYAWLMIEMDVHDADPDAEVVALSPRTLLESDRYVCEICGQGFQREQNLQMHRRRHKVPWRLVKRAPPGGGEDGGGGDVEDGPIPSCSQEEPASLPVLLLVLAAS